MMNAVEKCVEVTEEIIALAKSVSMDRDEVIGEIERLLDQRSEWVSKIIKPFSSEDQINGKKLIALDEEMTNQLIKIQMDIQRDMKELERRKLSAERYANPYAATEQLDGIFYDKRK
ncbi:flagellar protein FliT [Lederbergia citri]|uniref:Flagellar protein FliT n=1 Tax=Lederbergia citri TaxID=2833580 RepID=A0A942TCU8_9BACI|nr:flagellar protein FliT [Lederbergia citri]MBS4195465.1 flagellar protein FliT [Lederbergia citri]